MVRTAALRRGYHYGKAALALAGPLMGAYRGMSYNKTKTKRARISAPLTDRGTRVAGAAMYARTRRRRKRLLPKRVRAWRKRVRKVILQSNEKRIQRQEPERDGEVYPLAAPMYNGLAYCRPLISGINLQQMLENPTQTIAAGATGGSSFTGNEYYILGLHLKVIVQGTLSTTTTGTQRFRVGYMVIRQKNITDKTRVNVVTESEGFQPTVYGSTPPAFTVNPFNRNYGDMTNCLYSADEGKYRKKSSETVQHPPFFTKYKCTDAQATPGALGYYSMFNQFDDPALPVKGEWKFAYGVNPWTDGTFNSEHFTIKESGMLMVPQAVPGVEAKRSVYGRKEFYFPINKKINQRDVALDTSHAQFGCLQGEYLIIWAWSPDRSPEFIAEGSTNPTAEVDAPRLTIEPSLHFRDV